MTNIHFCIYKKRHPECWPWDSPTLFSPVFFHFFLEKQTKEKTAIHLILHRKRTYKWKYQIFKSPYNLRYKKKDADTFLLWRKWTVPLKQHLSMFWPQWCNLLNCCCFFHSNAMKRATHVKVPSSTNESCHSGNLKKKTKNKNPGGFKSIALKKKRKKMTAQINPAMRTELHVVDLWQTEIRLLQKALHTGRFILRCQPPSHQSLNTT